jgi:hypothetical protein
VGPPGLGAPGQGRTWNLRPFKPGALRCPAWRGRCEFKVIVKGARVPSRGRPPLWALGQAGVTWHAWGPGAPPAAHQVALHRSVMAKGLFAPEIKKKKNCKKNAQLPPWGVWVVDLRVCVFKTKVLDRFLTFPRKILETSRILHRRVTLGH